MGEENGEQEEKGRIFLMFERGDEMGRGAEGREGTWEGKMKND